MLGSGTMGFAFANGVCDTAITKIENAKMRVSANCVLFTTAPIKNKTNIVPITDEAKRNAKMRVSANCVLFTTAPIKNKTVSD